MGPAQWHSLVWVAEIGEKEKKAYFFIDVFLSHSNTQPNLSQLWARWVYWNRENCYHLTKHLTSCHLKRRYKYNILLCVTVGGTLGSAPGLNFSCRWAAMLALHHGDHPYSSWLNGQIIFNLKKGFFIYFEPPNLWNVWPAFYWKGEQ